MATNTIYRWRIAVREDGTYAYLYINQYDFTGFGGITVTDHRVCLGSLEGCLISDNPGERGLYLYALLRADDDYGYYEDNSQGTDRDRIRDYWHKLGKPTADCDAPDVNVEWFPWAEAGFIRQGALRTIAANCYCYGSGRVSGWAATHSAVTEKLAVFGVAAAEIDAACAAVEAERDAAHAAYMAGKLADFGVGAEVLAAFTAAESTAEKSALYNAVLNSSHPKVYATEAEVEKCLAGCSCGVAGCRCREFESCLCGVEADEAKRLADYKARVSNG